MGFLSFVGLDLLRQACCLPSNWGWSRFPTVLWQRHISRWLCHKSNLQGCSEGCVFQWRFWALGRWTSGHLGNYLHGLWGSSSIISTHLTALFGFGSMGHYLLHLVTFTLVALPVSLRGNKVMEVSKANRNAGHITFMKESHHMPCSGNHRKKDFSQKLSDWFILTLISSL